MNINDCISKISTNKHLSIELILLIIIVFMMTKCTPNIKVDSRGIIKDSIETINLTKDGTLVISKPNGEVIVTSDPNENLIKEGKIKRISSIVIITTEDIGGETYTQNQVGFFDSILSSAIASQHNNPDHIYRNITTKADNASSCSRYDVTLNWKYVGACH